MDSEYRNPTEIELNRIVSVGDRTEALLVGDLLKLMDMVSCLSAEKHAKLPCVTLMMDDLKLTDTQHKAGQVLNVNAKLTRPWGSSMEVIVNVSVKDIFKGERKEICQAYFTYVAISQVGKAKLPRMYPVTLEERKEFTLAAERRRLRFKARNAAKAKSSNRLKNPISISVNIDGSGKISMGETATESIELVLPGHANHHKSTFGGQIMAWLVATCTISASRICDSPPTIVAVNGVHFLAPSAVGDRIVFKAMVNKIFDDHSMEVGCSVEAYKVDGEMKHINSAYITFMCFDKQGQPKSLPTVVPTTADQLQHQTNAVTRRQEANEKTLVLKNVEEATPVLWKETIHDILAMHNVITIKKLSLQPNWVEVSTSDSVRFSKITEGDQVLCFKGETTLTIKPQDLFACLHQDRAKWDPEVMERKLIKEVDEDDKLIMLALSREKAKPAAFVLMESRRPPSEDQEGYLVALGCISLATFQIPAQYDLGNTLLSGFFIKKDETDPNVSHLAYIAQMKAGEQFSTRSDSFEKLVKKLQTYV